MRERDSNPLRKIAMAGALGLAALGVGGCSAADVTPKPIPSHTMETPAASPITLQENNPKPIDNDSPLMAIVIPFVVWSGALLAGGTGPKKKSS